MRTVLILAYYFPPMGLGGTQRPLKFVKYLSSYGWRPIVVTVKDVRYYGRDTSLLSEIPPEAVVERTGSLDPLRLARLFGKGDQRLSGSDAKANALLKSLLFPDNQVGWIPFAVLRALKIIRRERVDALFTTFPPASGHLAGYLLRHLTGLPWIADFRDVWTGGEFDQYPTSLHRTMANAMQREIVDTADHLIAVTADIASNLTTLGAEPSRLSVVPNGYDPADFVDLAPAPRDHRFLLVYSGTLNAARNPEPLFRAIRLLLDRRPALESLFAVRLVGATIGLDLPALLQFFHLESVVDAIGYLPHRDALAQLLAADALVLLLTTEASLACGVPTGKIYEYLASGKPVLGVAPPGAAGELLARTHRGTAMPPEDTAGVADALEALITAWQAKTLRSFPIEDDSVKQYSRLSLTQHLTEMLNDVTTKPRNR